MVENCRRRCAGITLSKIFPHHRLDRFYCPLIVLGRPFLVIRHRHLAADLEINQLSDGHARIDAHRLADGDFKSPGIAKSDVSLSRRCMDIDAEPADTALSFEKWDVAVS